MKQTAILLSILTTVFFFSTAIWIYEVGVSYFQNQYLTYPLTHYDFFPLNIRNDELGIIAFVISIVSLFMMQLLIRSHRRRI